MPRGGADIGGPPIPGRAGIDGGGPPRPIGGADIGGPPIPGRAGIDGGGPPILGGPPLGAPGGPLAPRIAESSAPRPPGAPAGGPPIAGAGGPGADGGGPPMDGADGGPPPMDGADGADERDCCCCCCGAGADAADDLNETPPLGFFHVAPVKSEDLQLRDGGGSIPASGEPEGRGEEYVSLMQQLGESINNSLAAYHGF